MNNQGEKKERIRYSPGFIFEINCHPWFGLCVKHFNGVDGYTSSEHFVIATSPEVQNEHRKNGRSPSMPSFKKYKDVLLRVHSECFLGDVLNTSTCDCGWQLKKSIERIQKDGVGVIIYLRQEGRGIGLFNKMHTFNLPHELDTFEKNEYLGFKADYRNYDLVIEILKYLNISSVNILTGNPIKIKALKKSNILYKVELFNYAKSDPHLNLSLKGQAELRTKLNRGFRYITESSES